MRMSASWEIMHQVHCVWRNIEMRTIEYRSEGQEDNWNAVNSLQAEKLMSFSHSTETYKLLILTMNWVQPPCNRNSLERLYALPYRWQQRNPCQPVTFVNKTYILDVKLTKTDGSINARNSIYGITRSCLWKHQSEGTNRSRSRLESTMPVVQWVRLGA